MKSFKGKTTTEDREREREREREPGGTEKVEGFLET